MNELLTSFTTQLDQVAEQIKKSLIETHKSNPSASVPTLIKRLEENQTELAPLFQFKRQDDTRRMTEKDINDFYLSCISDLYQLSGTAFEIQDVLAAHERMSREKINKIKQAIESQEGQLRELRFLRDNKDFLEVFDQDLGTNTAPPEMAAVYNRLENQLSLKSHHTQDVFEADLTVKFLGNPDRTILPDYDLYKVFDKFNLSAWYEIVGYKTKPEFWLDLQSNSVEAFSRSRITISSSLTTVIGDVNIPSDTETYAVGEWISIGHPFSANHESHKVFAIDHVLGYITIDSPLLHTHYAGEPIFKGRDLVQSNGAVAILDIKFSFPQQVNFARFIPFSTNPVKLHGIFIPSADTERPWTRIDGTEIKSLNSITSKSFKREISSIYRVIIEQSHGGILDKPVHVADQVNNLTWDSIYEAEFKRKVESIETKLVGFDKEELRKANADGYRGYLVRKSALASIVAKNASTKDGTTFQEINTQLNNTFDYVGSTPVETAPRQIRYVYDIGLAEIQLIANIYKPWSVFEGSTVNPKQNADIFIVKANEVLPPDTSIKHYVKIETGEEIPVPNISSISSTGQVISRNELLDVEPSNRRAVLSFQPFDSAIVVRVKPESKDEFFRTLPVLAGQIVEIPAADYSQKHIYETSYVVKEEKLHLSSNVIAQKTIERFTGTDENGFVKLLQNPHLELGIINDNNRWIKKSKFQAQWQLNVTNTSTYVDFAQSFPSEGYLANNQYFGYPGKSPIVRTTELEEFLFSFFSLYSGDSNLWVERFFNEYTQSTLKQNLTYQPLVVKVNGAVAFNLSNYDGSPDTGFLGTLALDQQYQHFSNRIRFPTALGEQFSIEVEYLFKESTVQYMAKLFCNKKSNFWSTPVLNNALIATIG